MSTDKPAKELRTIKFQMMMAPSESEAIDNWRFANRVGSRAEAIRMLIRAALASAGQPS